MRRRAGRSASQAERRSSQLGLQPRWERNTAGLDRSGQRRSQPLLTADNRGLNLPGKDSHLGLAQAGGRVAQQNPLLPTRKTANHRKLVSFQRRHRNRTKPGTKIPEQDPTPSWGGWNSPRTHSRVVAALRNSVRGTRSESPVPQNLAHLRRGRGYASCGCRSLLGWFPEQLSQRQSSH